MKVYKLQTANEIWNRLKEEYGAVSEISRAHAEAAFHSVTKYGSTSVYDHVTEFSRLQYEVDYHRGTIPPLTNIQVNLAFLRSLSEEFQTFQQATGARIHTITPAALFAEVIAYDNVNKSQQSQLELQTNLQTKFTRTADLHPPKRFNRRLSNNNRYRKVNQQDNNHSDNNDRGPRKFCRYCKRCGHQQDECHKLIWKRTQANDEESGDDNGDNGGNGRRDGRGGRDERDGNKESEHVIRYVWRRPGE
jgi:gag-polypeptide of LTR copia-type